MGKRKPPDVGNWSRPTWAAEAGRRGQLEPVDVGSWSRSTWGDGAGRRGKLKPSNVRSSAGFCLVMRDVEDVRDRLSIVNPVRPFNALSDLARAAKRAKRQHLRLRDVSNVKMTRSKSKGNRHLHRQTLYKRPRPGRPPKAQKLFRKNRPKKCGRLFCFVC